MAITFNYKLANVFALQFRAQRSKRLKNWCEWGRQKLLKRSCFHFVATFSSFSLPTCRCPFCRGPPKNRHLTSQPALSGNIQCTYQCGFRGQRKPCKRRRFINYSFSGRYEFFWHFLLKASLSHGCLLFDRHCALFYWSRFSAPPTVCYMLSSCTLLSACGIWKERSHASWNSTISKNTITRHWIKLDTQFHHWMNTGFISNSINTF